MVVASWAQGPGSPAVAPGSRLQARVPQLPTPAAHTPDPRYPAHPAAPQSPAACLAPPLLADGRCLFLEKSCSRPLASHIRFQSPRVGRADAQGTWLGDDGVRPGSETRPEGRPLLPSAALASAPRRGCKASAIQAGKKLRHQVFLLSRGPVDSVK